MTLRSITLIVGFVLSAPQLTVSAAAGDWPMWRYDAGRTAASPEPLPAELSLQWVRQLPPPRPAWPASQEKVRFDASYEPVVMGRRIFVGSMVNDSVTAYDTDTGTELWQFFTNGPVRFAPVCDGAHVYAVSDDGYLYCLSAEEGTLVWKFRGGPSDRQIVGNHRLISSWPARGGAVLADGVVYFAASIWPSMGVFVHAVDADTGKTLWTNSALGSRFTLHPHNAEAFGSIVPQGYLALSGNSLVVSGGRSNPAVLDHKTGMLRYFNFEKKRGDYRVYAQDNYFFVAGGRFDLENGNFLDLASPEVITDQTIVESKFDSFVATALDGTVKTEKKKDRRGRETTETSFEAEEQWVIKTSADLRWKIFLMAGRQLYAGSEGQVACFEVSDAAHTDDQPQDPVWTAPIDSTPWNLVAGDDKLFVVTLEGSLYCFGSHDGEATHHTLQQQPLEAVRDTWSKRAADLLQVEGTSAGYALAFGIGTGRLIDELLQQSTLHVVAIDPDADKVARFRRRMNRAGLYGKRVAAMVGEPANASLPPYLANLIVSEAESVSVDWKRPELLKALFGSLRPYGGVLCLPIVEGEQGVFAEGVKAAELANAQIARRGEFAIVTRSGALPGAANWTHQYGDPSNSVVSKDRLVKAPLGLLWFGGPSNDKILPRHGHGPSPQVAGGRLFIEGPHMLRAVDVYTGRVLWEKQLEDLGTYFDVAHHFTGANEIGSNYVSLADAVYVLYGEKILELDAATGTTTNEFSLEPDADNPNPRWGFVTVWNDLLVAASTPVAVAEGNRAPDPVIPKGAVPLVQLFGSWRYFGGDPPGDWTAVDYDDASWNRGLAGFGFGDDDDSTELTEMRGNFQRLYLRRTFDGNAAAKADSMTLMVNYDDAFIAYINGQEIARARVKSESGAEAKGIRSHEADGFEAFPVKNFRHLLRSGKNVLALEGHNRTKNGRDFSLDPYLLIKGEDVLADEIQETEPSQAAEPVELRELLTPTEHSSASRRLFVINRHSGQILWSRDADYSYRHNCIAVAAGKVFCIDGMSAHKTSLLKRRGAKAPRKARILALDAYHGGEIWSNDDNVFGTFLNYSVEHDVLLEGGSAFRDRAKDEAQSGLVAYRGSDGKMFWEKSQLKYDGPCLLWRDKIITNGQNGFQLNLLDGERTGWKFSRMYGCNTIFGSEHLLTFRSGAAGFCDLAGNSGTGNIGGFRSSCTTNLIVADGVLNAPDFTRDCTCSYQNQTSLALVHMPEAELWTFNDSTSAGSPRRLALNFGAPGDRRAADGTLWLEYPQTGGPSPPMNVTVSPEKPDWFTRHSSLLSGDGCKWVAASGAKGLESVTVTLPAKTATKNSSAQIYRVRLHFVEPDEVASGDRVFSIALQGVSVLEEFDIYKAAGGRNRPIVREFSGIQVPSDGRMNVTFAHSAQSRLQESVLCGIEIVAEDLLASKP